MLAAKKKSARGLQKVRSLAARAAATLDADTEAEDSHAEGDVIRVSQLPPLLWSAAEAAGGAPAACGCGSSAARDADPVASRRKMWRTDECAALAAALAAAPPARAWLQRSGTSELSRYWAEIAEAVGRSKSACNEHFMVKMRGQEA